MDPVTEQAIGLLRNREKELDGELIQIRAALKPFGTNGKSSARRRASKRPVRGGRRAEQALRLIRSNPGIKVPELAKKMKLKNANYLYRVIPGLPVKKDKDGGLRETQPS